MGGQETVEGVTLQSILRDENLRFLTQKIVAALLFLPSEVLGGDRTRSAEIVFEDNLQRLLFENNI